MLRLLATIVLVTLVMAAPALAQASGSQPAGVEVRHLIGVQDFKQNSKAALTIQGGSIHLVQGASKTDVAVSSIEDAIIGTETIQGGGTAGTLAKTAAIAAPYGTGAALKLMLRTKVDVLTLVYRGSNGELHGAVFTLKKGAGQQVHAQLVAAGAKVTPLTAEPVLKERAQ